MSKPSFSSPISRRSFLKTAGGVGLGAALAGTMPMYARGASLQDTLKMSLWWWADNPAFGAWVDDTVQKYQTEKGVEISTLQMDTCCVISQFTTAAAAGEPPDIQFFFNGIYHMENVWLGYIEPLNDLIPEDVRTNSGATSLSIYDGKQYRLGWYPAPMLWEYNKNSFDKAGLDADNPPKTWDDFMGALDKLKTAGITPFGGGLSDGFWGEWYLGHALVQSLDSSGEAIDLFIGDKDFRDPKYYEFWSKLEELVKNKYLNDDMLSLDLFTAINKVVTGELAITQSIGSNIPPQVKDAGDIIGVMPMPIFGKGKLAGLPITDSQGWGIPSAAPDKQASADFLIYMQSPDRLNAFWDINGFFPSNKTWDATVITEPTLKGIWETWVGGQNTSYIPNLMPTQFWTDAMFVAAQEIVSGTMTGEQAGEQNAGVVKQWRDLNPDLIENYQKWATELATLP
ncbi:MAG: substrate-binding domain-containing protein [Chloroflexota bacterium]